MRAISLCLAAFIAVLAAAQPAAPASPVTGATLLRDLTRCRDVAEPAARLACFERGVSALETAERNRDVRLIDRETVNRTQRELFGLPYGRGIVDDGDGEVAGRLNDRIEELSSTLRGLERDRYGKYIFDLENGQRWIQTDTVGGRGPRTGEAVRVRRGVLGSYILTVGRGPGMRVRRTQ